jgi:hypothetical protein
VIIILRSERERMEAFPSITILVASTMLLSCSPDPKEQVVSQAEMKVKAMLKDPDSAEFSDMHLWGDEKIGIVCGRVNAKNSFGGYIGYQRFYWHVGHEKGVFLESEGDPTKDGFDIFWNGFCLPKAGPAGKGVN